jgi:RND family efflux transporter MFP subunit
LLPWVIGLAAAIGTAGCNKQTPPTVAPRTVITAIAVGFDADHAASSVRVATDPRSKASAETTYADDAPAIHAGDRAFSGNVAARSETVLSFRVGGLMVARPFQTGDRVARGAILARLDDADALAQANAADTAARSTADNVRIAAAQRDRDLKQADAGLIAPVDRERSQQQFLSATADNARAQQQRITARNALGYQQIRAEQPGTITDVRAEPGQTVAAGQAIYTYAVDGPRDFIAQVADTTVAQLRVGMPATVVLNALPRQAFPVHVREIAAAANPRSQTYAVKLAFDRIDDRVLLGMSGTVHVMVAASALADDRGAPSTGSSASVVVPATALFHQGQTPAVWVVDPTTHAVALRVVTVAQYGARNLTVRNGLRPGEQVVARGVNVLSPGMTVTPHLDDGRAVLAAPSAAAATAAISGSAASSASVSTPASVSSPASTSAAKATPAASTRNAEGTTR